MIRVDLSSKHGQPYGMYVVVWNYSRCRILSYNGAISYGQTWTQGKQPFNIHVPVYYGLFSMSIHMVNTIILECRGELMVW